MKELQELMNDIKDWSDRQFGDGERTLGILHHLQKEVPELIQAVGNHLKYIDDKGQLKFEMIFEFADCFMLLLDAASHVGLTADDLIIFTGEKLEINKKRKWGTPDENGVVEHIEE